MDSLRYLDFELSVERTETGYTAQVLRSPVGEASADFTLPFTQDRLENLVLKMNPSRGRMRGMASDEMEAARELGGHLFESVFSGEVLACLRSSIDEAYRQDGVGLRLKLRLQEVAELADLPWEYLFDRSLDRFLAQSSYTPVVRYIELPQRIRPLATTLPLRILVMISSPDDPDFPKLEADVERQKLEQSLATLVAEGKVVVDWMDHATLGTLQRLLRTNEYHVFHYIGHGGFDRRAEEGVLILEDENGRAFRAAAYRLGPLLHDHRSLRLAVLNSCEGARNSRDDPFAGMAASLIRQGIPAVVAMQFEITDRAALTFSGAFYTALAEGLPVDATISEARKAILVETNDIEWGTPVLYMRASDGVLFELDASAPAPVPPSAATPPAALVEPAAEAAIAKTPAVAEPAPPDPVEGAPVKVAEAPPIIVEPEVMEAALAPEAPAPAPPRSLPSGSLQIVQRGASGRFKATAYDVILHNESDRAVDWRFDIHSDSTACIFEMPQRVMIAARSTESLRLKVSPSKRRRFGGKIPRRFSVVASAEGGGPPLGANANFDDLSWGWLPLGGFAALTAGAAMLGGSLISNGGGDDESDDDGSSSLPAIVKEYIYFESNRDGNEDIYRIDEAGVTTRVTDDPARDILPDANPYGNELVFSSNRDGNLEVYRMDLDGKNVRRLTDSPGDDVEPDISPNGKVAFERILPGGTPNYEIFIVPTAESDQLATLAALTDNFTRQARGDFDPSWSTDGERMAFSSDRDGNIDIYLVYANGLDPEQLTNDPQPNFEPAWSPDGGRIAFETHSPNGNIEIVVIDTDGSDLKLLTNHPAQDRNPVWSPDGTLIAFASNRTGDFDIYVMSADGSDPFNLTNTPGSNEEHPTWVQAVETP